MLFKGTAYLYVCEGFDGGEDVQKECCYGGVTPLPLLSYNIDPQMHTHTHTRTHTCICAITGQKSQHSMQFTYTELLWFSPL